MDINVWVKFDAKRGSHKPRNCQMCVVKAKDNNGWMMPFVAIWYEDQWWIRKGSSVVSESMEQISDRMYFAYPHSVIQTTTEDRDSIHGFAFYSWDLGNLLVKSYMPFDRVSILEERGCDENDGKWMDS